VFVKNPFARCNDAAGSGTSLQSGVPGVMISMPLPITALEGRFVDCRTSGNRQHPHASTKRFSDSRRYRRRHQFPRMKVSHTSTGGTPQSAHQSVALKPSPQIQHNTSSQNTGCETCRDRACPQRRARATRGEKRGANGGELAVSWA